MAAGTFSRFVEILAQNEIKPRTVIEGAKISRNTFNRMLGGKAVQSRTVGRVVEFLNQEYNLGLSFEQEFQIDPPSLVWRRERQTPTARYLRG